MSLKHPVTPPAIDPGTVRFVAQRLNHYTTPGPSVLLLINLIHKCKFHICRSLPYMNLSSDITEHMNINRNVGVTVYNP